MFHGNNKSELELRLALELGVGRLVVDGVDELDRIEALVAGGLPRPRVLVRVTPGVEAHTHEYIATGADDSKFGFTVSNGAARDAAVRVAKSDAMELDRLPLPHRLADPRARVVRARGVDRRRARRRSRRRDRRTDRRRSTSAVAWACRTRPMISMRRRSRSYASWVRTSYADACAAVGLDPAPRLAVEAGRSIAGPAGLTLYSVGSVKEIVGVRTYVAVDGGMSDNPRPVTYGARYEAFLPAQATAPRPSVVSVAGKHCEQGDILVKDAHVPADLAVGDVLAMPVTGAYAYSMASNYNLLPRPAVVFVRDGRRAGRRAPGDLRGSRDPRPHGRLTPSCRNEFGSGSSAAATWGARWCGSSTITPT